MEIQRASRGADEARRGAWGRPAGRRLAARLRAAVKRCMLVFALPARHAVSKLLSLLVELWRVSRAPTNGCKLGYD